MALNIYTLTSDHGMTIQTPMPAPQEALPEKEDALATTTLNGGGGQEEETREGGGAGFVLT